MYIAFYVLAVLAFIKGDNQLLMFSALILGNLYYVMRRLNQIEKKLEDK